MDHFQVLLAITTESIKHLFKYLVLVFRAVKTTMEEHQDSAPSSSLDPRLLSSSSSRQVNLQEIVRETQEIRQGMMTPKNVKSKESKTNVHPHISQELATKIDSILAIVNNLQANQREIYNYLRAIAPKHSTVVTEGPTEHFESINQINKDLECSYLEKLRKSMKKSHNH